MTAVVISINKNMKQERKSYMSLRYYVAVLGRAVNSDESSTALSPLLFDRGVLNTVRNTP